MSKTIEIHGKIIGPLRLTTRAGEVRTVEFSDRGDGIGKAMIDADEAEILLNGNPTIWKPSFAVEPTQEDAESDTTGEAKLTVDSLLSLTVAKLTEAVADCTDKDLLTAASDAEAAGKNRAGFIAAIQARLAAI